MTDTHETKGDRTRQLILDTAAEIASSEGLEGLTIGKLASKLDMSKSGLFAHFGSKEELQLATVARARERFIDAVFRRAMEAPRGMSRLRALCRLWPEYAVTVFPGGCFFVAAATEFDTRPGLVRDAIAGAWREWLFALETAIRKAQELGELDPEIAPSQLAHELNAIATASHTNALLLDDPSIRTTALEMIETRLNAVAIQPMAGARH